MAKSKSILIQGVEIRIVTHHEEDYISLSDIANGFEGGTGLIEKWIRNKNTVEFLAVWETLHNTTFSLEGYHKVTQDIGTNRFLLSVKKWVAETHAIGILASAGRYGGTYAHQTIAIEFMMWLNPLFKLHWIQQNPSTKSLLEHIFEQWNTLDKFKNPNMKRLQLPDK
jgi:hypothetical protein